MIYLVTRHLGAIEWLQRNNVIVDIQCEHLNVDKINSGDVVVGILPVHLAAKVCELGGRYMHLCINIPPEERGKELSADLMQKLGAYIQEFEVITK